MLLESFAQLQTKLKQLHINLSGEEALKLKESADSLKKIMETIEL